MVQLKAPTYDDVAKQKVHFNSSMVQLKVFATFNWSGIFI